MAKARRIDFDDPTPINEEEDEETLAAIDQGIRDAEAGRTVPIEEVRKLLPKWITASILRAHRQQDCRRYRRATDVVYFTFTGSGARTGRCGGLSFNLFITSATARSNWGSLP